MTKATHAFSLFSLWLKQNNIQYMHTIGIDMSKDTFHAAFDDGKVIIFNNTLLGIKQFLKQLLELGYGKLETLIGTEATGVFHLLFCSKLRDQGWQVKVINPILTHRMIEATIRKVKTDRTDAIAIRKSLLTGVGYLFTDTPEI